jgi:putative aldouronate transport system permease protein
VTQVFGKGERLKIKFGPGAMIFDIANYTVLLLIAFVTLYPMWYILIISVSNDIYVSRGLVNFLPRGINFEAYKMVFQHESIWRSYANTFLYTGAGVIINILFTSMCAYPLSRADFYGRSFFTFVIIITMFISGGMIPLYLLIYRIKMINTIWAIVLPGAISTYNMIIMRTFFSGIPISLTESAYLDGANDIQILTRIILPLSKPIIATLALFYAVGHWNSFLPAILYLNSKSKYPLQVILRDIVVAGDIGSDVSGNMVLNLDISAVNFKYAVIIIAVVPILCVYPFLQKHFTKGVMIGAMKG